MTVLSIEPSETKQPDDAGFDVRRLEHQSPGIRLFVWFCLYPRAQRVLDALRWVVPGFRVILTRYVLVLRQDQVRQVLMRSESFPVPWGWKMRRVTADEPTTVVKDDRGRNFVLGMKTADRCYRDDYATLARAFPLDDPRLVVAPRTRELTTSILNDYEKSRAGSPVAASPFDIVEQLLLKVPAMLCRDYYGLQFDDPVYLGKCTLPISSFVFALRFAEPRPGRKLPSAMRTALDAAVPWRATIRRSIAAARLIPGVSGVRVTPLARLMQPVDGRDVDEDRIHAMLFGMVLGFVPTNLLAAGNLLETLLRYPAFMVRVTAAARSDDDQLLWSCLRETLRFRNINLVTTRTCTEDCALVDPDGRILRIKKGATVLAMTQSAMFDRRHLLHPDLFDAARPEEDYLMFGTGQHWCIGTYIAIAQLTQMFKVLFKRYDVLPADGAGMRRFGTFPLHMNVMLKPR